MSATTPACRVTCQSWPATRGRSHLPPMAAGTAPCSDGHGQSRMRKGGGK